MASSEHRRRRRRFKRSCAACQERKARFSYRGQVRADRDHTLCFECYRAEINRARARRLIAAASSIVVRSPFDDRQVSATNLNERQMAHRRLMLGHLQGARSEGRA